MTVKINMHTVSITKADLDNIQDAHQVMEGGKGSDKPLEFLEDSAFIKLQPVVRRLAEYSLSELILATRKWAEKLKGEFKYPHVTETEGELVYQHCLMIAAARSFSPVLAMPHSGQGFSTVEEWKLQHPALLKFEVTVGGLDTEEEAEQLEGLVGNERLKHLKALAMQKVHLEWRAPGSDKWELYTVGANIPEGSAGYRLEYEAGVNTAGAAVKKRQFNFVVTETPRVMPEDIVIIGKAESATQARVTIVIKGVWCATSQAEKFAATLSKLCVDAVPEAKSIQDTELGGIALYNEPEVNMDDFVQKAVDGTVKPVTLPHVGLGQETAKGAPSYNPAAATVLALTGKRVLRKTHQVSQPVEVGGELKDFPIGDVVWDSDEFVAFRREWSKATVRTGVWGRWCDDIMLPILKSAVKYDKVVEEVQSLQDEGKVEEANQKWENYPYRFVPAGETQEDGFYYFHRAEVRIELAPMTMETSTQLENLGSTPTGGMFWELQNTFNVL